MEGQFLVAMEGGSPWGFTLQGGVDFRSPLRVGRVTAGGRAAQGGLAEGDYILAINEQPTDLLKHLEAQQIIKKARENITLMCTKIRPTIASPTPTKPISFTYSPPLPISYNLSNGHTLNKSPRSPRTTATISKPPPPTVKWTSPQQQNGYGGQSNGHQSEPSPSNHLPNNVQVFDAQLESIEQFQIQPSTQQENGVDNGQQKNGDFPDEGVECDGVEVNAGECEVVEPPRPLDEVEQFFREEEERRRKKEEERRREREEQRKREREERERREKEEQERREKEEERKREREEERRREEEQRKERALQEKQRQLEEASLVVPATKEPGWYKQMFQSFQTTVQEAFPGATKTEETENSSPKETPEDTYVYDYRGLRVRSSSTSSIERSKPVQQLVEESGQRPRSATTVSQTTTEDVLTASRKPTSYKTNRYTTTGSRDYWKKKDEEHAEWDRRRRNSQEQRTHVAQLSPDQYSTKTMHPLLQPDGPAVSEEPPKQSEVFTRIDASKLHGALDNAMKLGTMEQEGVPSTMLPLVAQTSEEEKKAKTKELDPPPGPKAKAIYNFDAQNEKELPFKKGDILDLTHTVDDNWLKGMLDGRKGIFPKSYVKVLTREEARQILTARNENNEKQARALYDFEGERKKELTFSKGDILTVTRKIDANWYEGYNGEEKGIFPITYVELLDEGL